MKLALTSEGSSQKIRKFDRYLQRTEESEFDVKSYELKFVENDDRERFQMGPLNKTIMARGGEMKKRTLNQYETTTYN